MIVFDLSTLYFLLFDEEQRHCHHVVVITGLFPAVTGKAALFLAGKCGGPKHRREFFVRYSALHTGEYVACSRLRDLVGSAELRKRKHKGKTREETSRPAVFPRAFFFRVFPTI